MKTTVFTLSLILLLMATLCSTTYAGWIWASTVDFNDVGGDNEYRVSGLAFAGNDLLFSKGGNRMVRWNIRSDGSLDSDWFVEEKGGQIDSMIIPRDRPNFVVYGFGEFGSLGDPARNFIYMRYTGTQGKDPLSWRGSFHVNTTSRIDNLAITADGTLLASGHGGIRPSNKRPWIDFWRVGWGQNREWLDGIKIRDRWDLFDIDMHPDGDYVYAADGDQNIDEWRVRDHHITEVYSSSVITPRVVAYGFSRIAGAGDESNAIRIWNWSTGKWMLNLSGHTNKVRALVFNPTQSTVLASGSWDNDVRVWNVIKGTSVRLTQPTGNIEALAFSPNGRLLAAGGEDGKIYIWRRSEAAAPAANHQTDNPAVETSALLANYPNPFNPETWIPYQLAKPAEVTVSIHAADGKLVRTLELGQLPAGAYQDKDRAVYWDGKNEQAESVASGVYFYTLKAGDFSATKKMLIRK